MPSHYNGTPQEIQALDTFIKLTRAVDSLYARLARRGALGDLTLSQFGVLEALYHLGSMSQSDICSKLLKSGGNMTLVIDNLEKHGLVQRKPAYPRPPYYESLPYTCRKRLDWRSSTRPGSSHRRRNEYNYQ